MHAWRWMLGLLAVLLLAGCGGDPIVGKWGVKGPKGRELVIEFRGDGSLVFDTALMEAQARATGMTPEMVAPMLEMFRQAKITWKQEKPDLYKIEGTVGGKPSYLPPYVKLAGDQLSPAGPDGAIRRGPAFTRK